MVHICRLSCDISRMFRIILYVLVKSQKVRRVETELSAQVRLFKLGVLNLGTIGVWAGSFLISGVAVLCLLRYLSSISAPSH